MTQSNGDMRFHVIRDEVKLTGSYEPDGERCHVCNLPTEIGADPSRRYCSNGKCNALIVGEL